MSRTRNFRLGARKVILALAVAGVIAAVGPRAASLTAQTPGPEGAPVDPDAIQNQFTQALVRLLLDRPIALAQATHAQALESAGLAQDLTPRLATGQGPNGGPVPQGLDIEVGQIATATGECAERARQNLLSAAQDLDGLKGALGGELEADPGPDGTVVILQWVAGLAGDRRQRNAAIETCLQESAQGLGRLRAYRSLYPN